MSVTPRMVKYGSTEWWVEKVNDDDTIQIATLCHFSDGDSIGVAVVPLSEVTVLS